MLTLHQPLDRVSPTDDGQHDTAHGSGQPLIHLPQIEVADVVRQHGQAFLERYGHILCGEQHRALRAIEWCYTAALGGHKTRCDHCGHEGCAYNPCRNRHGPKCQGVTRAAWLANRQRDVLDTPYAHAIFTLPQALSPLVLHNPRPLYGLLFRAVSQSLLDIAGDPTHLGAEIGGMAILHTWAANSSTTRTSTASCPPGAWRRAARAGCRVGPTSSCRCGSSRGVFGDCFLMASSTSIAKAS